MGQDNNDILDNIFTEAIPFKDLYYKNENSYLITAKDAEKYIALLVSLINET